MKKLIVLSVIILIALPLFIACRLPTNPNPTTSTLTTSTTTTPATPTTPIPDKDLQPSTGVAAPDDIVTTPGGFAYRANVMQGGVTNPWPPVQVTNIVLGSGSDTLTIYYRNSIETKAGETRNNIVNIIKVGGLINSKLTLYSVAVPDGIGLTNGGGAGLPGTLGAVLAIEISPDVAPAQYTFKIGIEIDGKDYGTIPCAINVIK